MTFFVMNLACFLLKIGSAPNFRPGFKFFTWQSAFVGSILSAAAMFFIDEAYASTAVCLLVFLFLLIHYLSPPKHWGDVSQNLIYHQVRKYLLRLKPEHIKFWRPQILLLVNDPRKHIRLVQFCNSLKKGGLYILGHVIVTNDFNTGVHEAKTQQAAWTQYISESSRIKAFMQLTMSPTIVWGVRNLILSSGLGGLRPNIAVLGFYNMEELRKSRPLVDIRGGPPSPARKQQPLADKDDSKFSHRRRGDTTSRLMEGFLPTDVIKTESMMDVQSYMTILEDLALRYQLNVAIGKGFDALDPPRRDGHNAKRYIDLWPIQMALEVEAEGRSVLAWNWQTYTLILQLGYVLNSVPAWKSAYRLRVLAFVEYESDVEVERARVKALLEKLRIQAEVVVSWLACGQLSTYEMIIHGHEATTETAALVNDCLKADDWWVELQRIRGSRDMTSSQQLVSLNNMLDSSSGPECRRPSGAAADTAYDPERRRPSVALLADLPKTSTISQLSHMGINMGMRTQNLLGIKTVLDDSDADTLDDSDSDEYESNEGDFNDAASDGAVEDVRILRRPLLSVRTRSRSHGEILTKSQLQIPRRRPTEGRGKASESWSRTSYGTVPSLAPHNDSQEPHSPLGSSMQPRSRNPSPDRVAVRPPPLPLAPHQSSDSRAHSRHGSSAIRFSSHLVPETTITDEDGSEPRIMFAQSDSVRSERPDLARRPSSGRRLSKLVSEYATPGGRREPSRSVFFAELQEPKPKPNLSTGDSSRGDAEIDIGRMMSSSSSDRPEDDHGSTYATQALPLSFNDLPNRAQHLILNELLRQNSRDTAVLYTTLPIPQEGTCQSEEASIQYLSDVEVLCNDLPPVLLLLSNNATVTVGL
jgi:potassium/chloride transporter 9